MASETTLQEDYFERARVLSSESRYGEKDRLGSVHLIDNDARLRAAASIRTGITFGLGRSLRPGRSMRGDDKPVFDMERFHSSNGEISVCSDHVELDCHGSLNTHIDAFNHVGLDSTWYSGWGLEEANTPSVAEFAEFGLFTRGVIVDIPALRGTEYADEDVPVLGDEIEQAVQKSNVSFQRGDALLLYMGRDRFEAAGREYEPFGGEHPKMPGIGREGGEWIVDNGVSILAWDFLDALHPSQPPVSIHMLVWAIGLVIIDNCDYSKLVPGSRTLGQSTGGFAVAPLLIEGATGCNVNPLVIL